MVLSWQVLAGLVEPITYRYSELMESIKMTPEQYGRDVKTRYKELFGDYFVGNVPHDYMMASEMGFDRWEALPNHIKGAYIAKKMIDGYAEVLRSNTLWEKAQASKDNGT